ncbi:hypothetical protein E2C01_029280 [Portunus trituberculatus]|uniref:Uncharacterized protein n=1 Tax=Portunus trituberculatus TaxID=210409 RepID=A0A5B7EU79_PORTR|nr:hypothetical protein [Portunus trituberculatus]
MVGNWSGQNPSTTTRCAAATGRGGALTDLPLSQMSRGTLIGGLRHSARPGGGGSGGTASATGSNETCSRMVKNGVNADAPGDQGGEAVREDLSRP